MTTKVVIEAHCADDTEVVVTVHEGDTGIDPLRIALQSGETKELYVYGGRTVTVSES